HLFGQSNPEQKAGLLNTLLAKVNPSQQAEALGSTPAAAGSVPPAQAQQITPEQAEQLAAPCRAPGPLDHRSGVAVLRAASAADRDHRGCRDRALGGTNDGAAPLGVRKRGLEGMAWPTR